MKTHDNLELEMEEPLSIQVEQPASTKKYSAWLCLRCLVILDDAPNQKYHRPIFIIIMCILHIFIHLSTYTNMDWRGQNFAFTLFNLFKFYMPCMRPTPDGIRIRIVNCNPSMKNTTCYYDNELKKICFSFMYPHQLWRMITVNLLHMSSFHLLATLSKQLLYGILLERKYGSVRIAVIYWLSELGASLGFMLKNREKCK
jgi:membrane associated rhomboid family serine protease